MRDQIPVQTQAQERQGGSEKGVHFIELLMKLDYPEPHNPTVL